MEALPFDAVGARAWDEFCRANSDAWFFHTSQWLRYQRAYGSAARPEDRSIGVTAGGELLGIFPLTVEDSPDYPGRREVSSGGGPCWGPVVADGLPDGRRREVVRHLLQEAVRLAHVSDAWRATLRLSPLSTSPDRLPWWLGELTRAGWVDVSLTSVILDVTTPAAELWQGLRKGHRSDVRRAGSSLRVEVDDQSSPIRSDRFAAYRRLHARAAGRTTRPEATFHLMENWISDGLGLLFTAFLGDDPVGCAYLLTYKDGAYYASAANDPAAPELPIGHLIQWHAIQWLSTHGFSRYELGPQNFGVLPYESDSPKELSIGRFKRGFGGQLMPLITRERIFDPVLAEAEYQRRARRLRS